MSTNEDLPQSDDFSPEQISSELPITIQPSSITPYPGAADWSPAGNDDSGSDSINAMAFLHAARRHWLAISLTGLACATLVVLFLSPYTDPWWGLKPQYEAEALLTLEATPPKIISQTADQSVGINEFEYFRETQAGLVKSRFVIMAALRDPKLKARPCMQREDDRHNAIAWLTEQIKVDFKGKNAGLMAVSASQPDKEDAAAMVNAVVAAYKREIIDKVREERQKRLTELTTISGDKENEVRTKREQLHRELEMAGGDEQTMAIRATLATTIYADTQREYQRMKSESRGLLGRLEETKRILADLMDPKSPGSEIGETEYAMLLNNNPAYRDLLGRRALLRQIAFLHTSRMGQGSNPTIGYRQNTAELTSTENLINELESKSKEQVRNSKRIELQREISRLQAQSEVAAEQLRLYEKEVEKRQSDADAAGKSTINAQMLKAELENLKNILQRLAEEREALRVELNSKPRVEITGDQTSPAAVPESETHDYRNFLIIFAAAVAMAVPALTIVLWDLRKERINSSGDVSKRLKIPVMGAVPMIPAMVMRRLGDSTKKSQLWRTRFTEAVDGVAARLLRKAECEQTRVVLITSALSGEGKTTLATQLAMSLARAHRNTVLVDFDLRQPTLDGALGLPLGPGVCEALRGDGDILDMVQQTGTEFLSVVTAGVWHRRIPAALGNGAVATLLDQLRKNFDFVIIDSSPLLPVVDTRLVSQNVDAVVLAVFRDISQGSKVLAAQELLDAFGARSVEAVITGGEEHGQAKKPVAMLDEEALPVENEGELRTENSGENG
jgi:polysaccharide biosynthesis transport protein